MSQPVHTAEFALATRKAEKAEKKALKKAKKAKDEEDAKALLLQERKEAKALLKKKVKEEAKTVEVEEAPPAAPSAGPPPTIVTNVTRLGKEYIDQDGFLFDPTTRECAGFWNEETQQIEECDDDDDED